MEVGDHAAANDAETVSAFLAGHLWDSLDDLSIE
jgi:hypothetical protein